MTRAIRFKPDPLDHALIDFSDEKKEFSPTQLCLIVNESYTGCALVLYTKESMADNQEIRVQVGNLEPMLAKIIWVKVLDEAVYKIGLHYIK